MSRIKILFLSALVVSLAVPSLWAQRKSVKEIQTDLQKQAEELHVPAVCTATVGGPGPLGYLRETNKCSSASANYGLGQSKNVTVGVCADRAGIQGTWGTGMSVGQAGVRGSTYPTWGSAFNVGGFENQFPVFYTSAISPSPDVVLTLGTNRHQSVFGLEFNNPVQETYDVTVATTAGNVVINNILAGGVGEPNNQAQRIVALCNTPAITGVTIHCVGCADAAQTAVGQVRGDRFTGF